MIYSILVSLIASQYNVVYVLLGFGEGLIIVSQTHALLHCFRFRATIYYCPISHISSLFPARPGPWHYHEEAIRFAFICLTK